MGIDGDSESWYKVRLPKPTRSLHADDLLQTLDWESDWNKVLEDSSICDMWESDNM